MTSKAVYVVPLMYLETSQSLGVKKKVFSQAAAFRFLGVNITIVDSIIENTPYPFWALHEFPLIIKLIRLPAKRIYQFWQASRFRKRSFPKMLEKIREEGSVVVYLRHVFFSPRVFLFYFRLSRLKNVEYVYLEIPTWPYDKEPAARFYDRILRIFLKHMIDKIVTFSKSKEIHGVPTIRITNGIATNEIPISQSVSIVTNEILIVVAASLNAWAGIDRLLRGLAIFLDQSVDHPKIRVEIAGSGRYSGKWPILSQKLGLADFVHFKGGIVGSELEDLFLHADIAIGNLANHRRGLRENSDLKNREYCARGVPFVISGADTAFPESFPFVHRVEANNKPLNICELLDFFTTLKTRYPDFRKQMRNFAEQELDWRVVLKPVVADIKSITNEECDY